MLVNLLENIKGSLYYKMLKQHYREPKSIYISLCGRRNVLFSKDLIVTNSTCKVCLKRYLSKLDSQLKENKDALLFKR
jgi:hypothetical protein